MGDFLSLVRQRKGKKALISTEARVFKYFMVGWARLFFAHLPSKNGGQPKTVAGPLKQ